MAANVPFPSLLPVNSRDTPSSGLGHEVSIDVAPSHAHSHGTPNGHGHSHGASSDDQHGHVHATGGESHGHSHAHGNHDHGNHGHSHGGSGGAGMIASIKKLTSRRAIEGYVKELRSQRTSRNVLLYVTMKMSFALIELLYGLLFQSMGCITAFFHTTFDTGALMISLSAILLARNHVDRDYTFGYQRFEVLAAFSNAIFLIFVALFLIMESFHALYKPAEVHSDEIGMALLGLGVDIAGLVLFKNYAKLARVDNVRVLGKDGINGRSHFANLHSIFLHALADTFLHGGLLITTWLTNTQGFVLAQGAVFTCIAVLIAKSAYPLFEQTSLILLQSTPSHILTGLQKCLREISFHDGVLECRSAHWWSQAPGMVVGSLHVRVRNDADEKEILTYVHSVLSKYITHLTVQIEKDQSVDWMLNPNGK